MPKGSTGTSTSRIINAKKVKSINCNCKNCFHSKPAAGTIYCSYYDTFSPKRKKCSRYYAMANTGVIKRRKKKVGK